MIEVKKILKGTEGRIWFVQDNDAQDVWVWNPKDQKGVSGDVVSFGLQMGGEVWQVAVTGPWCSNLKAMLADVTGAAALPARRRRLLGRNSFQSHHFTDQYRNLIDSARSQYAASLRYARRLKSTEAIFGPIMASRDRYSNCFISGDTLYVNLKGTTKAEFSEDVRRIGRELKMPPDIRVGNGEYIAEFKLEKGYRVHVYLSSPSDCKLIEKEVTVMKSFPSPECVAALKTLEDE